MLIRIVFILSCLFLAYANFSRYKIDKWKPYLCVGFVDVAASVFSIITLFIWR